MKGKLLNWDGLLWQRFQELSIHIANSKLPELRFVEYLKQGNDQEGIDNITTALNGDGKYTVIQCKNENLNSSKLDKIINEFKRGTFWGKTSSFILFTSSDMQTSKTQKRVQEIQKELLDKDIVFECWDGNFLEEELRNQNTLVEHYFGLNAAKEHCFAKRKDSRSFADLGEGYIHRNILKLDDNSSTLSYWSLSNANSVSLKDYLLSERLSFPKVCIIGDPYQGKSLLLKQTAYEITKIDNPFVPIFIELKSYNIQPIDQLLKTQEGAWLSSPLADLIIFIDGLDEVPTNKFNEAIGHIRAFMDAYPYLSVVFSCRKIFFYHYQVREKIKLSNIFELAEFSRADIESYLKRQLGTRIERFQQEVRKASLDGLLTEPFYLKEMISAFKNPPYKLPGSKAELIELFIRKSIENSSLRKLSEGKDFSHKVQAYKIAIHKLAFTLQVLGLNALPDTKIQDLFEDAEQELLQHSGLVTISNQQWSFSSALFQEFLSARVLSKLDFGTVIKLCTVGTEIIKIKSKWIQTISTLLAILPPEDSLRECYINLVEKDNIELFFETDRTKYDSNFRLQIIKKLFHRTIEKDILTLTIYEDKIGAFIGSDDDSIDFILNIVGNESATRNVKALSYKILLFVHADYERIDQIINRCKKEIQQGKSSFLASLCVQLLNQYKSTDFETAILLAGQDEHNLSHVYRMEVYSFLDSAGLAGQFYNYGVEGIGPLTEYNEDINHHDSESSLLSFLLQFEDRNNLQLLLQCIQQPNWVKFIEHRTTERKEFMSALIDRCSTLFTTDPHVLFDIVNYAKVLNVRYFWDDLEAIGNFFESTNTSSIAAGLLIDELFADGGYMLCGLLTDSSVGYLLYEYEERNSPIAVLWNWVYGLRKAKKNKLADMLTNIYNDLLALEPPREPSDHDEWVRVEAKKSENDLLYFNSKEKFKEGLTSLFGTFGRKNVSTEDLFIDAGDRETRINAASNLLFSLILFCAGPAKTVTLASCIDLIDNKVWYEYFLASEILKHHEASGGKSIFKDFLEQYFLEGMATGNFVNCYHLEEGRKKFRRKEKLLCDIFKKFRFTPPAKLMVKLLWMEKRGAKDFQLKEFNSQQSLSDIILEKLGRDELPLLREEVYNNMVIGIEDNMVFASHAAFCKYFDLKEAREIIFKRMSDQRSDEFELPNLAKIYLALEGKPAKLLKIIESAIGKRYAFIGLIDTVAENGYSEPVKPLLSKYINSTEEDDLRIPAALRLASLGEINGLSYMVDFIKANGRSPISIQGKFTIQKIDTKEALNLLVDIAHHLLDKDISSFHESARSILLEWIFSLARKSESDLNLVINFLEKQLKRFKDIPYVTDINWYIERCIEGFRESAVYTADLNFIDDIFNSISVRSLNF